MGEQQPGSIEQERHRTVKKQNDRQGTERSGGIV